MSESSSFISAWTETTSRSKAAAKDATWSSMISPAASAAAKLAIALRYATAGLGIVVAAGAMFIWSKDIFILIFGFRSAEEILPGIAERRARLFDDWKDVVSGRRLSVRVNPG